MNQLSRILTAVLLCPLMLPACSDDTGDGSQSDGAIDVPDTYAFDSRFEPDTSSVSYSGQVMRQVLITDLKIYIGSLSDSIDADTFSPAEGDVLDALNFYYRFDSSTSDSESILLSTDPPTEQKTYGDISSDKDLTSKIAGNDSVTDHADWSTSFAGWSDDAIAQSGGSISTPEGLVTAFFSTLDALAAQRELDGATRTDPDGNPLPVHVTEAGQDLQQLVQKFLLMAINFSQGADDYMDDDVDGKGLLADHATADDGDPYSALEHAWDEGFGYFGAAQHYLSMSDDLIADTGYSDADGNGSIDLKSEYNFGASVNAAKRDRGSAESAATDFTNDAMNAFLSGRALLAATDGALSEDHMAALQAHRNTAVLTWEKAIAATVVHYINDTLQDMAKFGTDDYSFTDHAKHFSELKGFALGFQFNPRSPLSDSDFAAFHQMVGDAPVLSNADAQTISDYKQALLDARALLAAAYEFDQANLGDDNGENGW